MKYIGGKGPKAKHIPPKPQRMTITCVCGVENVFQVTSDTKIATIPCECGINIKWRKDGQTTIEQVVAND